MKFKLEFLSKSCIIRMPNFLIKKRESCSKAGMATNTFTKNILAPHLEKI